MESLRRQPESSSRTHFTPLVVRVQAAILAMFLASVVFMAANQATANEKLTDSVEHHPADDTKPEPAESPTASIDRPVVPTVTDNYYVPSRGWGTRIENDPPSYVKPLSLRGWDAVKDVDWLDFGLEHRMRIESRDDDLRRNQLVHDTQFLHRTRLYLGVREVMDPLRFAIEFQDSRQFGSIFPETDREVDENDFLQAYAELHFKDVFGPGRPLRFQAGRMTFDYADRKLLARSRWGNTTNAFDGFRLQLGARQNPWQIDMFATQPVERHLRKPDHGDDERWFYGVVGQWRKWSKYVTIEPYYFRLDQQRKDPSAVDRHINTLGVHLYGPIAKTNFDYDLHGSYQFGDDGPRDHCAFAGYGELGYTFSHSWKPRVSVSGMYASGDRDPMDARTERFDRLFGSNHSRSTSDYITFQNVISPKFRLELQPGKKLRLDAAYGAYWLASDSDMFGATSRSDPTGESGDFAGQELEFRARYQLHEKIELEVGYSYFLQGDFIDQTGDSDDSDFFYFQATVGI